MRTQAVAQEFGHSTVEPEHLLLALLEQPNGPVAEAVTALDADPQALAGRVRRAAASSSFWGRAAGG